MPYTIAIAGKGGTGKTTLAALIIYYLLKTGKTPILAVDADPNANLNETLGLEFDRTIVSTVDKFMSGKESLPTGVPKGRYLEFEVEEAVVESKGFDLLVMGRTEGPQCYCYANDLLRGFMDRLSGNYPYVVMDNEAGMEHLSRRTTRNVDVLLITANPTVVALRSAGRIHQTARELDLNIGKIFLVINHGHPINRINPMTHTGRMAELPEESIEQMGLPLLGTLPYDGEVVNRSIEAKPLLDLPEDSPAVRAVAEMMERLRIGRL